MWNMLLHPVLLMFIELHTIQESAVGVLRNQHLHSRLEIVAFVVDRTMAKHIPFMAVASTFAEAACILAIALGLVSYVDYPLVAAPLVFASVVEADNTVAAKCRELVVEHIGLRIVDRLGSLGSSFIAAEQEMEPEWPLDLSFLGKMIIDLPFTLEAVQEDPQ